jgi:hypothetical protein
MMEVVSTCVTSLNFYKTTCHNVPEDCHLHTLLWQPEISHLLFIGKN